MSERNISNTSMIGSMITMIGVGYYTSIANETNWWIILIIGLIVFGIGMTKWGGGR
jgi:1,4-dihydroxy-2-naphthoate octaprenyltransferase